MPDQIPAVVTTLAARYPGAVAARALWGWAGGTEAEVEYLPTPVAQWTSLWKKASAHDKVTPVGLLRQALLDHPGDPELLAHLLTFVDGQHKAWRDDAGELAARFEALSADVKAPHAWVLLQGYPPRSLDTCYAMLTLVLQGRVARELRAALEAPLAALAGEEQPLDTLTCATTLQELLALTPLLDDRAVTPPATPHVTGLGKLLAVLSTPGSGSDELTAKLKPVLDRLELLRGRATGEQKAVVVGLVRRLELIQKLHGKKAIANLGDLPRAVQDALWSTTAPADPPKAEAKPATAAH